MSTGRSAALIACVLICLPFAGCQRLDRSAEPELQPGSAEQTTSDPAETAEPIEIDPVGADDPGQAPEEHVPEVEAEPAPATPIPIEFLPGVWIDVESRAVEFDAEVAIDCHHPETPNVYLEVIACTPDTREHEALVVTSVRPSHVHAALLALDVDPGRPGAWRIDGDGSVRGIDASGSSIAVAFLVESEDGSLIAIDPATWIVGHQDRRTLRDTLPETGWVFAGSRIRQFRGRDVYDADGTGQLIGLHTFGSETIAWTTTEHHDSGINAPRWLANNDLVPEIGTPVRVRLRVVESR